MVTPHPSSPFELHLPSRILFGSGCAAQLPELAAARGGRMLCVTGSKPERWAKLWDALNQRGLHLSWFQVPCEPTHELLRRGCETARQLGAQCIVAVGGGSVLDLGKAVAALSFAELRLEDHLEVVGRGVPVQKAGLPCIALPTTAGTGAEVTRNSVITISDKAVKVSVRGAALLPQVALVDPELTLGLPSGLTLSTGMDALTQLIEPRISCRSNSMTALWSEQGIARVAADFARALSTPDDLSARSGMAQASLLGGLALSNAGLGAVHGFAGPLGGMFPAASHGALCAALLAPAMEVNLAALRSRAPFHPSLHGFQRVAAALTGIAEADPERAIEWIRDFSTRWGVRSLSSLGVGAEFWETACEKAAAASSMKANPIPLLPVELRRILELAS